MAQDVDVELIADVQDQLHKLVILIPGLLTRVGIVAEVLGILIISGAPKGSCNEKKVSNITGK